MKSVKALSDLSQLLKTQPTKLEQAMMQTTQTTNKGSSAVVSGKQGGEVNNEELRNIICDAMGDYRAYTLQEIVDKIASVVDIEMGVLKKTLSTMSLAGFFDTVKLPGNGGFSYTLKKGKHVVTGRVSKFKHDTSPIGTCKTDGAILASEGLDVCIWKAMQDMKPRAATEIGEILQVYGLDRVAVKDRAIALMKQGWFKREEKHHITLYTLRKNIPMPAPAGPVATVKAAPLPAGVLSEKVGVATKPLFETPDASDTKQLKEVAKPVTKPAPTPAPAPAPIPPQLTISADDGLPTNIWKIMSDRQAYCSEDIALLLDQLGVKPHTVTARLSRLDLEEGWFTKEKRERRWYYTLKPGIPMPTNLRPYRQHNKGKAEAAPATTPQVQQPASAPSVEQQEQAQLAAAQQAAAATLALKEKQAEEARLHHEALIAAKQEAERQAALAASEDAPLIEMAIIIKGMSFSDNEAQQLVAYLADQGFGTGSKRAIESAYPDLVNTSITIKGRTFNTKEVEGIAAALIARGFHKSVV